MDPDILTGYNIINFDLPYLLNRAKALRVNHFPYLGRINNAVTTIKTSTFESKAYGKRENKVMNIEGRIQFDLLQVRTFVKLDAVVFNKNCSKHAELRTINSSTMKISAVIFFLFYRFSFGILSFVRTHLMPLVITSSRNKRRMSLIILLLICRYCNMTIPNTCTFWVSFYIQLCSLMQ